MAVPPAGLGRLFDSTPAEHAGAAGGHPFVVNGDIPDRACGPAVSSPALVNAAYLGVLGDESPVRTPDGALFPAGGCRHRMVSSDSLAHGDGTDCKCI